jgi:hypothetical protein
MTTMTSFLWLGLGLVVGLALGYGLGLHAGRAMRKALVRSRQR